VVSSVVVMLGVGSFSLYRVIAKRRDLRETLSWIDQTYNPHEGGDNFGRGHGWEIHYIVENNTEKVTEKFNTTLTFDGTCNVTMRSETLPIGVFTDVSSATTSRFNLRDIDPASITIKSLDSHNDVWDCADPEQVKNFHLNCDTAEIFFAIRNGAASINDETVTTYANLTGSDHEVRRTSKSNKDWWLVDDVPYSHRLEKALRHAVELCGAQTSRF